VDADPTIVGFGHALRCSALVEALGPDLDVVVAGDDAATLSAIFPGAQVRSVAREGFNFIFRGEQSDAVIVDLPRPAAVPWPKLRSLARLVVAVDDEGGAVDADIVINGSVPESCYQYPALRPGAIALTGPAYSLLRGEFWAAKWWDPDSASVAIVAGSGARARDWSFALAGAELNRSAWGEIQMAVSSSFPDLAALRAACERAGINLVSGLDAHSMAQHLARAQVALITGGMVMLETLAVGTPAVVFPQVDNMIAEVQWFAKRGAIRDLGYCDGMNMARVGEEVALLLRDRGGARIQASRGGAIVDGRGAERAAAAIAIALGNSERSGDKS
jgi:spore coat polysaccharide biosynthesis predicted glycosyltransferase SpsG